LLYDGAGKQGTNEAAIASLKDVIASDPDSALAHAWLAHAYIEHGGESFWVDSAIDEAARAQRTSPTLGIAAKQLARAYVRKGWYARAIAELERARTLGSLNLQPELTVNYFAHGRYDEAYSTAISWKNFNDESPLTQIFVPHILFSVGENDAAERTMRPAITGEPDSQRRTLFEADIALYRGDFTRCRKLAGSIEPGTGDSVQVAAFLVLNCAVQQGDFAGAFAALAPIKSMYARGRSNNNVGNPVLEEAILLEQVHQYERIPDLVREARQGLQAVIDAENDSPRTWLRMAAAQRLSGEKDAALATLEHAFTLGLNFDSRTRFFLEFLPFIDDPRFAELRDKSQANIARQRERIIEQLDPGLRAPIASASDGT
jgi:tetratricopeptide (TPR) repeat protein